MFTKSFEKTAGFAAQLTRAKKLLGVRPKPVSESRIQKQLSRSAEDAAKVKTYNRKSSIYENLKDQSKAKEPSLPFKNKRRLEAAQAAESAKVKDPAYQKMKATEKATEDLKKKTSGKPTFLGRMARRHPVLTGLGTYAAAKTVFGDKPQQQEQPPAVIYPNQSY